ncbi:MAG: hypothetical protein ABR585_08830 [Gemmatimonadaceae bacterium]
MTARVDRQERHEEFASLRTSIGLWFGFLGGPVAGFLNVSIGYPAVDRACVTDSSLVLHVLTLLFLAVAVGAGLTAWRLHERVGDRELTGRGLLPRSRFMTSVGILTAALAALGIIMQWIPVFFLRACQGT